MSIPMGPIGRGRPGPGLKVDPHATVRLGKKPKPRLCDIYERCNSGERAPAIVEITTMYRLPGSKVHELMIVRYCMACFQLDMQDHWSLWRKNRADVGGTVIVRQPRKVWLTTLVNGEVPCG